LKRDPGIIMVVGARPQFIKAAPLAAALQQAGVTARILHTGQHYDHGMSAVFFGELGLPEPAWNLGCGGGTHGAMTGAMLAGIENILLTERPGMTVVLGDTNSTLAGALAAAKLQIPVAHVEAGLRSFNRRMPEEHNRVCTDHLSDLLFCSSEAARRQLAAEGLTRGVHVTGDIMADGFLHMKERVAGRPFSHAPSQSPWALLTLHRPENTEFPDRMRAILTALGEWGRPVLFPVHPRTEAALARHSIELPENVQACEPLSYGGMVSALLACEVVLTDSGGLQKEAYWAGRRCVTLREETEWTETVAGGWNRLAGADATRILAALRGNSVPAAHPPLYGDGGAAQRIARIIADALFTRHPDASRASNPSQHD
jgi:UDP-N-acetylglucosamine 2-epimerase